ncbi:MAG TPA: haloacid dehalogenase, partial [Ktedonobacterales bacterium]
MTEEPRLLHALPGRLRVQVSWWSGQRSHQIEARLRQIPGVRKVQANALTGSVLLTYDASTTSQRAILEALRSPAPDTVEADAAEAVREEPEQQAARPEPSSTPPPVLKERHGHLRRARVAMRGLDRSPELARRVVERLERHPGVRVHASQLTGRVLVEYVEHEADLDDLIAEITGMELPDTPGEDHPAHPMDPGPLIQSASRTIGASLGLSVLAARRAFGI